MIDLLAVYECPKCGEVLEDTIERVEFIDTVNDDVWIEKVHSCGSHVVQKTINVNGVEVPELRKVDHERWLWATGFYDEDDEDEEYYDTL